MHTDDIYLYSPAYSVLQIHSMTQLQIQFEFFFRQKHYQKTVQAHTHTHKRAYAKYSFILNKK